MQNKITCMKIYHRYDSYDSNERSINAFRILYKVCTKDTKTIVSMYYAMRDIHEISLKDDE